MPYKNILLIDNDSDDTEFIVEAVQTVSSETVCRTALNPAATLEELKQPRSCPILFF